MKHIDVLCADYRDLLDIAAELYHALKGLQSVAILFQPTGLSEHGEWFSSAIERAGDALQHAAPLLATEGAPGDEPEAQP